MTVRELSTMLAGLPEELLDLQVKFDDDGHPQTVHGVYIDDSCTNPGDRHVKLACGTMPRRFGDPLAADDTLMRLVERNRENDAPVDFTQATVQVGRDGDTGLTAVTLIVTDTQNHNIHTGIVIVGRRPHSEVVTSSRSWRVGAGLDSIAKEMDSGGYVNCLATDLTFAEMREAALCAMRREVESIRARDSAMIMADVGAYAMRLARSIDEGKTACASTGPLGE